MENRYTADDVKILVDIVHNELTEGARIHTQMIYNDNAYTIESAPNDYLKCLIFETIRLNINNMDSLDEAKEMWNIYRYVFETPKEDVPLYVNNKTLIACGLVKWRLRIGK